MRWADHSAHHVDLANASVPEQEREGKEESRLEIPNLAISSPSGVLEPAALAPRGWCKVEFNFLLWSLNDVGHNSLNSFLHSVDNVLLIVL
eukprot:g51601.t1